MNRKKIYNGFSEAGFVKNSVVANFATTPFKLVVHFLHLPVKVKMLQV
jgi:hypothetical protein